MSELILICDDAPVVHETLGRYLDSEGFSFVSAYDGEEGLSLMEKKNPDLVILDVMMPKMNGTEVIREIRKNSNVPVIMLTARGEEIDRILGLELGADDYIVKPFSNREVVARIKAVFRRLKETGQDQTQNLVRAGKLTVNLGSYEVHYDGAPILCTPKEVEILHLLLSRPGQVFNRETMLSRVWGYDFLGDTRVVDTQIKRIRRKLPDTSEFAITTVYGVGYKFEVFA